MKIWNALAAAVLVHLGSLATATVVTYDFEGSTNVGGVTRQFTGMFEYESSVPAYTVYHNGANGPLQQGFRSSYFSAVRSLSITLLNGESVSTSPGGYIDVNNIQQAEPGSQVSVGLTVQAYAGAGSGTINGIAIDTLYLAFLPQTPNFNWDGLDSYFDGNAENLLQANPGLLPSTIDPSLTGTLLNPSIQQLASNLFLGTIHHSSQGVTTTVNYISSFRPHIPSPSALTAFAVIGSASIGRRQRTRKTRTQ